MLKDCLFPTKTHNKDRAPSVSYLHLMQPTSVIGVYRCLKCNQLAFCLKCAQRNHLKNGMHLPILDKCKAHQVKVKAAVKIDSWEGMRHD